MNQAIINACVYANIIDNALIIGCAKSKWEFLAHPKKINKRTWNKLCKPFLFSYKLNHHDEACYEKRYWPKLNKKQNYFSKHRSPASKSA